MMNRKIIAVLLTWVGLSAASHVLGNTVVVTPGSSAAYVFCARNKTSCPKSTVGRWMFKLQQEDSVADVSKKPDSFRDSAGFAGSSPARLLWNTGTVNQRVIDRVYVGYGEFKLDSSDPTKGTFSGIVDIPPLVRPLSCPAYSDYCNMTGPDGNVTLDTPFRTCNTTYGWTTAGPNSANWTNWTPNTGVIECSLAKFGPNFAANFGNGVGNCVAQYVQHRGTTSSNATSPAFSTYELMYQARVYDLQIREAADFTDSNCTKVTP